MTTEVFCKHGECRYNDGGICQAEQIELHYDFDDMEMPYFMCLTEDD